jgi:hypothetical protein
MKKYFPQSLNAHNVSDVRQIEVRTAEPLVPGHSHLEVEVAIVKLKKFKSSSSDHILAELIQPGGKTLLSAIHKPINFVWNRKELPGQWKESLIVSATDPHGYIYNFLDRGRYYFFQVAPQLYSRG